MEKEELIDEVANQLLGLGAADDSSQVRFMSEAAKQAGIQPTANVIKFARSFASKQLKSVISNKNLTRGQAIFASKANELPAQTIKDLRDGVTKINDGERFVCKLIGASTDSGGTVTELLNPAPDKAVGVSSFDDGGRMPKGANMLVEEVCVEIGNASGSNVDAVEYTNIFDAAGLPTAIGNAEISIVAAGQVIMQPRPLASFFSVGGAGMVNDGGRRKVRLLAPKMVLEGAKVDFIVRTPTNGSFFASNNTFIRASILGPETTSK